MREGWHAPVGEDGAPLVGLVGEVEGFDDKGRLKGDLRAHASQVCPPPPPPSY